MAVAREIIGQLYYPYIERTTDGGITWQRQTLPMPPLEYPGERFFNQVSYIDSSNILLIGDSGLIYRTTDAGSHWVDQSYTQYHGNMSASFLDSANGIITGGGGLLIKTTDAGNIWNPISALSPLRYFTSPKIFTPDSFCVFGYGGGPVIYVSQKGSKIDTTPWAVNPYISDSSGSRILGNIFWTDRPGEGIGLGSHAIPSQYSTGFSQTLLMCTSDGGYSWKTLLDRDTKLIKGSLGFSALPEGTAIETGLFGGLLLTRNWRGGEWLDDSITLPVSFAEIPHVSLLDSQHALILLDDGSNVGLLPFRGWIARLTLPSNENVRSSVTNANNIIIYPNPAVESITIASSVGPFSILDPLGRSYDVRQIGNTLDISSLPSGIYFISDGNSRAKFVKE